MRGTEEIFTLWFQLSRDEASTCPHPYKLTTKSPFGRLMDFRKRTQINTIYADTGDAIAKVHESKEFALPVLQWVYILAESDVSYAK